ncbi:DUF305 domain-containing protein [Asanoa iriomotensis]|uniref:DUF305 domain-containing protein n=1 Tax=Asanoa iriomotensis TaxID=234613 RepID=A0ABQ4BVN6_9ACTN|nr:DUF305 domain-containing protein [Asanoa iriomotensis]
MIAAAAVALAVGISIGILYPIVRAPGDTSAEAGFARSMSTHHAQAVAMAMRAYAASGDPQITAVAFDIALSQQSQIGTMQSWLRQWNLSPTSTEPAMAWMSRTGTHHGAPTRQMPGMATTQELETLNQATGTDLDRLFCDLMIRHHEGGIAMVDAVLAADPADEVRSLAEAIRKTQQAEVDALRDMRARVG